MLYFWIYPSCYCSLVVQRKGCLSSTRTWFFSSRTCGTGGRAVSGGTVELLCLGSLTMSQACAVLREGVGLFVTQLSVCNYKRLIPCFSWSVGGGSFSEAGYTQAFASPSNLPCSVRLSLFLCWMASKLSQISWGISESMAVNFHSIQWI